MTLEEIKKAADLVRAIEKLEDDHKTVSDSCLNPYIQYSYRPGWAIGYANFNGHISITKIEVLEIIEKRLASLKTDLSMMGVKT